MKLLFAIKALDDAKGGAERVLCQLCSHLAGSGHEVVLVSFDVPGGKPFYPLDPRVRRVPLALGSVTDKARAIETLRRIPALRRIVAGEQPDVAVGFMHSMFVLLGFALTGTGIPVIGSEHIVPQHYRNRRLEYLLLLASRFFLDRVTVLSKEVAGLYPPGLRRRMVAIPNPVAAASSFADPAGVGRPRKTILNVGRLDPQKDQQTLILAFARLAPEFSDWDLKIVGEGPLRLSLQDLIERLRLADRVFLPGATPEIEREYMDAQIFAMPSHYESFGLATAEAMAHGLPAVGFADCPGTRERIRHGTNGFLAVGQDRVNGLAGALRQLMDSADLRAKLGANARVSVADFSPSSVFALWENLLWNVARATEDASKREVS